MHQVASEKEETIPDLTKSSMKGIKFANADKSLFFRLIPYVQQPLIYRPGMSSEEQADFFCPRVTVYRNPADPSMEYDPVLNENRGKSSYAMNMFALDGSISLVASLQDGGSQTIAIADKYYAKCAADSQLSQTYHEYNHLWDPLPGEVYGVRRPTFADKGWQDVLPITDANTKTTRPSVPGKAFQVRPRPEDLEPNILSTPFRAGLTVALFDGSVRTIPPSVSETVFWALVTPAGGEVASLD